MEALTIIFLLIGAGCTAVVLLVLYRNLQTTGHAPSHTRVASPASTRSVNRSVTSPGSPFRAVSIAPGHKACSAVKALKGKYYLIELGDAPQLPLPACDTSKCGCRYSHHSDRRATDEDRRIFASMRTELHKQSGNEEQRKAKGRRATD